MINLCPNLSDYTRMNTEDYIFKVEQLYLHTRLGHGNAVLYTVGVISVYLNILLFHECLKCTCNCTWLKI